MKVDAILARNPLVNYPVPVAGRESKALVPASELARPASARARPAPPPPPTQKAQAAYDLWDDHAPQAAPALRACKRAQTRPLPPRSRSVPAAPLELPHPGASYHPDDGQHQELLAAAVAVEHMKALQAECNPVRPPAMGARVRAQFHSEMFLAQGGEECEEALEGGEEEEMGGPAAKKQRKLAKSDRNRQLRARQQRAAEAAARTAKAQRRDLAELKRLRGELDAQAAATAERAARRTSARAERALTQPARLGRHRFTPAPIAVALSEEVTGSMRSLAPVPTLLRDRYLALQRTEKIEPRREAKYKRSRSYITYEPGARGAKELEMAAAIAEARRAGTADQGGPGA